MTGPLLSLRDYQIEALEATGNAWCNGVKRPALVMATGTGKTVVFAHGICQRREDTGHRALVLVHRDELADQAAEKLTGIGLDPGIVKAERNEVHASVMVGSVQTLQNSKRLADVVRNGAVGLVVVDEAHHAAAPSYQGILTGLGVFDPQDPCVALGVSATLSRADGAGLGAVWQEVAYRYDILDGVADGWLVDPIGYRVVVDGLALSQVPAAGGDFKQSSLSEVMRSKEAIDATIEAWREHTPDDPGFVFTVDVESAKAYARAFSKAGFETAAVWGSMPCDKRRGIIMAARTGVPLPGRDRPLQVLVNCMIFTEGTDIPRMAVAAIARPTRHGGLYAQMVGRILRPFPGKTRAVVLDVVGASVDHALATMADLSSRRIAEIRPGETLREAAIREIKARNPALAGYVIKTEEVDLFHESRSRWLQTYDGVWFIPSAKGLIFLWPSKTPGRYDVGVSPFERKAARQVKTGVDIDLAMSWAEEIDDHAHDPILDGFGNKRTASWRRGRPSSKALALAGSLNLTVPESARAGTVSDIINVCRASAVLDRKKIR